MKKHDRKVTQKYTRNGQKANVVAEGPEGPGLKYHSDQIRFRCAQLRREKKGTRQQNRKLKTHKIKKHSPGTVTMYLLHCLVKYVQ